MSAPSDSAFLKKANLYLIGMMGCGKTTLGRKLAHRLGYRFLDTDALIEQTTGRSITDLFASQGEVAFREIETQVLAQVATHTCLVVATGGGIVTQRLNWSYLQHGIVIWLDVPVPVLAARLANDTTRPLLSGADLIAKLESLLAERQDLYTQADLRIEYESKSVGKTCDRIFTSLQQTIQSPTPPTPALLNTNNINTINPYSSLPTPHSPLP